jgi:hypothetical protein
MRARFCLTMIFLSVISPTYGAEGRLVLDVRVKLHHSTQWTQVFETSEGWHCATEHNPLFPLESKPRSFSIFNQAARPEKSREPCPESFKASLQENSKENIWTGCLSDEKISAFLRALGRECGRL